MGHIVRRFALIGGFQRATIRPQLEQRKNREAVYIANDEAPVSRELEAGSVGPSG